MKKPLALLLDIDGVILDKETDTVPELWSCLKEIESKGILVSFLTARPYAMTSHLLRQLPQNHTHIFDNGTYIVVQGKLLANLTIHRGIVENITRYILENDVSCKYGYSSEKSFFANSQYLRNLRNYMSSEGIKEIDTENITAGNSIWSRDLSEPSYRYIKDVIEPECISYDYKQDDGRYSLFIHPKGAEKGEAVKRFSTFTSISLNDMMFIGDDHRDIEALRQVGHPACPANAKEEVKKNCSSVSIQGFSSGALELVSLL